MEAVVKEDVGGQDIQGVGIVLGVDAGPAPHGVLEIIEQSDLPLPPGPETLQGVFHIGCATGVSVLLRRIPGRHHRPDFISENLDAMMEHGLDVGEMGQVVPDRPHRSTAGTIDGPFGKVGYESFQNIRAETEGGDQGFAIHDSSIALESIATMNDD